MDISVIKTLPQIKKKLQSYINEEFKDSNLKSAEIMLINILYIEGDKSQIEISHYLECDKAHTHRILLKLLDKNLIKYVNNSDLHIKNMKLTLTENGLIIAKRFEEIINKWHNIIIAGVSKEDLDITKKVVEKFLDNANNFKNLEKKNV